MTISKLSFADTETINLHVVGDKMPVDSFGYVSISVEDNDWRVCTPILLSVLTSDTVIDNVIERSTNSIQQPWTWSHDGIGVELWQQNVDVLDQLGTGRIFSADTWNWHKKNGYAIDKVVRSNLKDTLAFMAKRLSDSMALFFRGTDFDVPIWTTILKDNELRLPVRYNLVRDVRTAVDELLFTEKPVGALKLDKYDFQLRLTPPYDDAEGLSGETELRSVLSNLGPTSVVELRTHWANYVQTFDKLKSLRHTALVDAYLDCISYVLLKHYRNYNVAVVPVKL